MQLDQYISDLLYRYECVIVPEFGAFLSQYKSARVHETTHAFYPPKKELSFNRQLIKNDGLLTDYVATVLTIPYAEAQELIATQVQDYGRQLQSGSQVTLKNIGTLTQREERITFDPSYHLNYLTDAFGLAPFTTQKVAREVYAAQVEALEEKAPITITPEKRRSLNWTKYAAIGVIALAVSGLLGKNYLDSIETHNVAAKQEAQTQVEAKIQTATFAIENPLPAIKLALAKPSVGNYHVVGGAFRDPANAEKRVSQLRDKGYKARLIGKNRYGLHQVVYDSYTSRRDATNALLTVRKNDEPSAWLLIKKLD